MNNYWKSKVLPKMKKVFVLEKTTKKNAAASEACKTFDESKEDISKEFEEKKTDLQPKVLEIYEASSTEIKALIKEPKESGLKKNSSAVQKFIVKLVEIEFPGSKSVSEISTKYGPALIPGPIFFLFEKVSIFIPVVVEKEAEVEIPAPPTAVVEEPVTTDREIVIETEVKKEETVVVAEPVVELAAAPVETAPPPAAVETVPPPKEEAPAAPVTSSPPVVTAPPPKVEEPVAPVTPAEPVVTAPPPKVEEPVVTPPAPKP